MVRVAPIKMQVGPKVFWFDPNDIDIHKGDAVIVSTERGHEFAHATADIMEVSDELVEQLKSPLKPVLRIATETDVERAQELDQKSKDALPVFKEFAQETNEDMHPVAVEFLFDGDKAVFYFEAEERVDFRELVRKLAGHFHIRVDMRQIGVRDAARMIGGLGHCGQELCCKRLGGKFMPVSIRMAKEQGLSLNPQKISGVCGRLMCCLRYEYDTYKEVNAHAPKLGAKVAITGLEEAGESSADNNVALVSEINVPSETVTLKLEDGQTVKVPLGEMEISGEGKRPNTVSAEVLARHSATSKLGLLEAAATLEVASFTAEERLAKPVSTFAEHEKREGKEAKSSRRPRRRRTVRTDKAAGEQQGRAQEQGTQGARGERVSARKPRRSHVSQEGGKTNASQDKSSSKRSNDQRKRRRRNNDSDRASRTGTPTTQTGNVFGGGLSASSAARRPGQKSSGLRGSSERAQGVRNTRESSKNAGQNGAQGHPASSHRKPRRRSHTSKGGASDEN